VTNSRPVLQRLNLTWLLVVALIVLIADPLGLLVDNFSSDSYSQIRSELLKTKNAKVLLIGSWDDLYSLEYNNYWRQEVSEEFVESKYIEILDAASLGDKYFNKYLLSKEITHILVPQSSAMNGRVYYKFGKRGTIELSLVMPFFSKMTSTLGPFASVLFKVGGGHSDINNALTPKYSLKWSDVGSEFYEQNKRLTRNGLYRYNYYTDYEFGPDVSWFFDLSPERSNVLELEYSSPIDHLDQVTLELTLVAAYGQNAPEHVVIVSSKNFSESKVLMPNKPGIFRINVHSGENIKISSTTPCRLAGTFEPSDLTQFKYCFGIAKVLISPQNQVG
jgi:hypothetical protein